jgi:hypothetical protein
MEAITHSNNFPIFHAELISHIFFKELNGGKVKRKPSPKVTGSKITDEMQAVISDPPSYQYHASMEGHQGKWNGRHQRSYMPDWY